MFKTLFSFIIFFFVFRSVECIMSPICNQTKIEDLIIDSTVAINNQIIYFFTGSLITVVNVNTKKVETVSQITDFFNFGDYREKFIPPVVVAFTYTEVTKREILTLSTRKVEFNITVRNRNVLRAMNSYFHNKKAIQILYTKEKDWLFIEKDNSADITVKKYSNIYREKVDPEFRKHYLRSVQNDDKTPFIGFTDDNKKKELIYQLNGKNITSAVIIDGKIRLFANRYSCDVSLEMNKFEDLKIGTFTQSYCQSKPDFTSSSSTTSPSKTDISVPEKDPDDYVPTDPTLDEGTDSESVPEDSQLMIVLIFAGLALIIIVIITCVVIVLIIFCFGTKDTKKMLSLKKKPPNVVPNPTEEPRDEAPQSQSSESAFSTVSNVDYSKPIPVGGESPSEVSIIERPTDFQKMKPNN